jgi:putative transcriptional regulator
VGSGKSKEEKTMRHNKKSTAPTALKERKAKADAAAAEVSREQNVTFGSDVMAAIHEMAADLHRAGVIAPATMRGFDQLCLTPVHDLGPEEIKSIRERSGVSQAVMARVINVSTSTVGQWERGEKRPAGTSLKLLNLAKEKGLESIY